MLEIGSLLVPVDFSTGSTEALRYALALRRGERGLARDAAIEVVHAVDLESLASQRGRPSRLVTLARKRISRDLRTLIGEVAGGEKGVDADILDGEPRSAIPKLAAEFDLVVIGATGKLTAGELAPGGVAEAVIRRSPTPVLTVKWLTSLSALEAGGPLAPRDVVFATDFTPFSAHALRYAMAFAFGYGARITALHVVPDLRAGASPGRLPFPLHEEIDRFLTTCRYCCKWKWAMVGSNHRPPACKAGALTS